MLEAQSEVCARQTIKSLVIFWTTQERNNLSVKLYFPGIEMIMMMEDVSVVE